MIVRGRKHKQYQPRVNLMQAQRCKQSVGSCCATQAELACWAPGEATEVHRHGRKNMAPYGGLEMTMLTYCRRSNWRISLSGRDARKNSTFALTEGRHQQHACASCCHKQSVHVCILQYCAEVCACTYTCETGQN